MNRRASQRINEDRERRLASGAYLEDDTEWTRVREFIAAASEEAGARQPNNTAVREALARALNSTFPLPEPAEDAELNPALDGVHVRLRLLSVADHAQLLDGISASSADRWEALRERTAGFRAYVAATVASVRGLVDADGDPVVIEERDGRLDEEALDVLELNDLLVTLHNVAREFHTLDPFSRAGFGRSPPSTSATTARAVSSALPVRSTSGARRDATATAPRSAFEDTGTRPAPAHGGPTSQHAESTPPSPSTKPPRGVSGSTGATA